MSYEFTTENITSDESVARIRALSGGWYDLPLRGSQSTPRQVSAGYWAKGKHRRVYIKERRGRRVIDAACVDLNTGQAIAGSLGYAVRALNVIPRWDEA